MCRLYNDELMPDVGSMFGLALLWKVKITILQYAKPCREYPEGVREVRLLHDSPLEDADLVLLHNSVNHFTGVCKSSERFESLSDVYMQKANVALQHIDGIFLFSSSSEDQRGEDQMRPNRDECRCQCRGRHAPGECDAAG